MALLLAPMRCTTWSHRWNAPTVTWKEVPLRCTSRLLVDQVPEMSLDLGVGAIIESEGSIGSACGAEVIPQSSKVTQKSSKVLRKSPENRHKSSQSP